MKDTQKIKTDNHLVLNAVQNSKTEQIRSDETGATITITAGMAIRLSRDLFQMARLAAGDQGALTDDVVDVTGVLALPTRATRGKASKTQVAQ